MFSQEIYVFLILISASLVAFMACKKTHTSLAIGYLLMGTLLGSSGFGVLTKTPLLETLSQLGILFFIFTVGLEIPIHRIRTLKRFIFGFGFAQVFITTCILGLLLNPFFKLSTTIILAISFSFSSTAVIIQLLSERFELTTQLGRKALSILLFQDMVAIGLFVYVGILSNCCDGSFLKSFATIGAGLGLAVSIGWVLKKIADKLLPIYQHSEFVTAFIVISVIGLSLLTDKFHLSLELGAFIVGMAMASTNWRHQISTDIHSFRTLFLAIFFISMGLEIDLRASLPFAGWIIGGVMALTLLKSIVVMACSRWFKTKHAVQLSVLIGSCSEFIFIIFPLIKPELGAERTNALLVMSFLSMVITPLLFVILKRCMATKHALTDKCDDYPIIIAGFGHIGQTVARILEHNFIPFIVVDYDTAAVNNAIKLNYMAVHGDVRDIEFLKHLKIHKSKVFLMTFGHLVTSINLVATLKKKFPDLAICVQVNDYNQASRFSGLGVHLVIPENIESGMHMATLTLQCLGFSQEHTCKMVQFPQVPIFLGARN